MTDRQHSQATANLQTYLRQISYDTPGMTQPPINGFFGPATKQALEEFQAARGLPVTGRADQVTWELLYAAYRSSLAANSPRVRMDIFSKETRLEVRSRGFAVAATQFILQQLETQYGKIGSVSVDGLYSEETAAAVRVFQQSNALRVTGTVTGEDWNELANQYNTLFFSPDHRL